MKSFVAIDFETANQYRSSICSVGLVFVENYKIIESFYELIKPIPNFYCGWATDIHGIQYWDTKNAFEFPYVWGKLYSKINNLPLVAHNSAFDESCLRAVLESYEMEQHNNIFYCTYRESKRLFPDLPNHQLHTVSEFLGFHLEDHHNALADAKACAHIASKIFK
ncbi:MAG: 3'-5' exonuclease [Bacteroidales bacterium]|jgi:DNA polymerase-3 subunit epsilon|nr:3'-5' exonuclease [Bacteroidales bacterium]